ncbi:hypothetical protein NIES3275_29310 [Microchaete diplosiphon NIES-3275]|nr:hypothetical protein NIES3275_29310 [Microchaete diplosiphon NIES-3275]
MIPFKKDDSRQTDDSYQQRRFLNLMECVVVDNAIAL